MPREVARTQGRTRGAGDGDPGIEADAVVEADYPPRHLLFDAIATAHDLTKADAR